MAVKMAISKYPRAYGDDLCKDDPRLKYGWDWHRVASGYKRNELNCWAHFQCSSARIGGWETVAIQWGKKPDAVYYEARIEYGGDHIAFIGSEEKTGFKTRLKAQIAAEALLVSWIEKQLELIREG